MSVHHPIAPSWICRGCGDEWPCPTRRRELLAEYHRARVSLAVYLAGKLVEAAADLTHVPAGRLHARIVGWTRG
ncbi:flavin reductase [Micromonospora echinofusca]|uniref:Flavin reductase n=1 Tax=Micromonospora echinofusca TaxID=47858 RepID=A0ABS3W0M1_MICEH|nr:flavin reductase [Micromonospora echinofusca]MBO4210340.1 flavin reductase [Micromonospora echinofusca]